MPAPIPPSSLEPEFFTQRMDDFLPWMAEDANAREALLSALVLGVVSTSTTSNAVGTGSKTFNVGAGKGFVPGMEVVIAYTTTPTTRMSGTVTSYNSVTGDLVASITTVQGSGTYAAWSIGPAAMVSFDGQTFTDLRLAGKITETPVAMPALALNPSLGSNQTKTLTSNSTFTDSVGSGESMVLTITPAGYTMIWPAGIKWMWNVTPPSPASGIVRIAFDKQGSQLYGLYCGSAT